MADFKNLAIAFSLITLVIFATLIVVGDVAETYEIVEDDFGAFNLSGVQKSMTDINKSASSLYKAVTPSGKIGADIFELLTIFVPVMTFTTTVLLTPISFIYNILTNVLNFPVWLTIIISAIFLITIIFSVIKLLKVGE